MKRPYKKNPDIIFREIAGEFILVPIRNNVGDLNCIYTLNEVGAKIWELIDGKREISEIRSALLEDFEVRPEEAGKDLEGFLSELEKIDGIERV